MGFEPLTFFFRAVALPTEILLQFDIAKASIFTMHIVLRSSGNGRQQMMATKVV